MRLFTGGKLIPIFAVIICITCFGYPGNQSYGQSQGKLLTVDVYYPLNPRTMTYEMIKSTGGSTGKGADPLTATITVQNPSVLDGIEVVPFEIKKSNDPVSQMMYVQKNADGVFIVGKKAGDSQVEKRSVLVPILRNPIAKGEIFRYTDEKQLTTIINVEETDVVITVPYGTFNNCIKRTVSSNRAGDPITYTTTIWYAPSIGFVKSVDESYDAGAITKKGEWVLESID